MNLSWEILFGVGILVLGLVIAWGLLRNHTRNRANDPVTEEAARQLIDDPKGYERGGRDRLNEKLRP